MERGTAGRRRDGQLAARLTARRPAKAGRASRRRGVAGEQGKGQAAVTYRLRDWLISRQRYWGTPIPIVYCADCGDRAGAGRPSCRCCCPTTSISCRPAKSPLSYTDLALLTCPDWAARAERETDTMDTFMCSSLVPVSLSVAAIRRRRRLIRPIGQHGCRSIIYTGGAEHAVMHLLYTRFLTKAMRDLGLVELRRADAAPVQPGHYPGRRQRENVEIARQRGRPGRSGRRATAPTRCACS